MKEVKNQNLRNSKLGSHESMNVSIWIIVGFQQKKLQESKNLSNEKFCRLPVVSAHCVIGTEKYPDSSMILIYVDDDYSQCYG